jgi:hypothetical protein
MVKIDPEREGNNSNWFPSHPATPPFQKWNSGTYNDRAGAGFRSTSRSSDIEPLQLRCAAAGLRRFARLDTADMLAGRFSLLGQRCRTKRAVMAASHRPRSLTAR